jgi:nicotinamidase-related amidase
MSEYSVTCGELIVKTKPEPMKRVLLMVLMAIVIVPVFSQENTGDVQKPVLKPALVVIDVQNKFLPYMASEKEKALELINWSIAVARQYDIPVIRVYHTDPSWGPKPGTDEFEFPKSVAIRETDAKVVKNFPDGFKKTDLEKVLQEKGVNTLFLCGLSATGCVLATYHGAMDMDYDVFMLQDAIISQDSELTKAVSKICQSVSVETFNFMMKYLKN